jgi:hypothetical protein
LTKNIKLEIRYYEMRFVIKPNINVRTGDTILKRHVYSHRPLPIFILRRLHVMRLLRK